MNDEDSNSDVTATTEAYTQANAGTCFRDGSGACQLLAHSDG